MDIVTSDGKYKATVAYRYLVVITLKERYIHEVTIGNEVCSVRAIPYSALGEMRYSSVITARYDSSYWCHADIDCGAQRWEGAISLKALRSGLYKLGFIKENVDNLVKEMKKQYFEYIKTVSTYRDGYKENTPG